MPQRKQVALLLAKATQDEYVLDKLLNDDNAPIEIYGFHAQQAAEKLLKALLAHFDISYPLTHQLTELMDLASEKGIKLYPEMEDIRYLTPFAVEFRYDVLPGESEESVDKCAVRESIVKLRAWIDNLTSSTG